MGLSKNVMNMKFMQKSLARIEKKEEVRNFKDDSEWFLPNSRSFRTPLKLALQVQSVGYGSIAILENGDSKGKEKEEAAEAKGQTKEPVKDEAKDTPDFLKSIEKSKKKRKREEGGQKKDENERKKKKTKNDDVKKKEKKGGLEVTKARELCKRSGCC